MNVVCVFCFTMITKYIVVLIAVVACAFLLLTNHCGLICRDFDVLCFSI